ncbi:MAG: helical backbone metal receptor [Proteobacteria bacterium]|nr:helical backbone metal receptor [Pseudomonadota bacterium]
MTKSFYQNINAHSLYWLFLCISLLSLVSCDLAPPAKENKSEVRIITLSPHLAELVASAGGLNNLVGVVAYSDFPESVIDIQQVGDAFKLDYEAIISLEPDYILTWQGGTPIAVIEKLKSLKLNIIETDIKEIADIPKIIELIAKLTNTSEKAKINIQLFNRKLTKLQQQNHRPQTAFLETYHQPLYTVSGKHWMSEAIAVCGYQNIFANLSQLSAPINLEAVITRNPDVIINISNQEDKQWYEWQELSAVKNQQILTISPDVFSRPSMRLLAGIEQLCSFNGIVK